MLIAFPAPEILPLSNIYFELPMEKVKFKKHFFLFFSAMPHYAVVHSEDNMSHLKTELGSQQS